MIPTDRRCFIKNSLLTAAVLSVPADLAAQSVQKQPSAPDGSNSYPWIIDTNVNLLGWPFRRLKYDDPFSLVEKLRKHRVREAWAGSFEALFQKDIDGVNSRLVDACQRHGDGMLVPFGTVNLVWPTWEKRLQICHEVFRMPGIRIYPGYQPFDFDHPDFPRLLQATAERNMILQISLQMEDPRVHHPVLRIAAPNSGLLLILLRATPRAKVQFLHWGSHFRVPTHLTQLVADTNAVWDISNLEGNGAVGRLIEGNHWYLRGRIPAERLLFGSLAPYFPFENAALKLMESPLSRQQLEAIMEGNARRLRA